MAPFSLCSLPFSLCYSIWAAIHVPVVVAVLAALVDFTQQHTHAHARMIVGALLIARIAFPYYIESNTVRDRVTPIEIAGDVKPGIAQDGAWLDSFEQRIDEIPPWSGCRSCSQWGWIKGGSVCFTCAATSRHATNGLV